MTIRYVDKRRLPSDRTNPNQKRVNEFLPLHLDTGHAEKFGQLDLERLVRHATKDLDEIDRKREQEFKQYEMRKEYQRRAKLAVNPFGKIFFD